MLYEPEKFKIDYQGITIIHANGTDPHTNNLIDEKARIICNFFEEVDNRKNQTMQYFPTKNLAWTLKQGGLSMPQMGGKNTEPVFAYRHEDFVDQRTGLDFIFVKNDAKDLYLTDNGDSGFVFSVPGDKDQAKTMLDNFKTMDFSQH